MADSDTAPIETVAAKPKVKRSMLMVAPQQEYLCGYSIKQWMNDQIARHDPPLEKGAELRNYNYRLILKARKEVYPYGDYFPATVGKELHPIIAFASNKPGRLPRVPRQDKVEKLQQILGTSDPPWWFARY